MKLNEKELHVLFDKIKKEDEKEEAFNTLYKEYNKLIYGVAFSILKNKQDSEDITQTVFTKIFKLSKEKLPQKCESSWLYAVTKNEAITYLRKKHKEININDDEIYNIQVENDDLEKIENIDAYRRAINSLSKKEQEIVSLKILSGFSFSEIAKILNMPIGTVQWKYYKAIHSLQLLLGNISMFVITIALYIFVNNNSNIRNSEPNIAITNEQIEIDNETEETTSTENSVLHNGQLINETTQQESKPEENIEYIQSEQVEQNITQNRIGNSLLVLSTIFLLFTVIFAIIYIKHKKKKKNKK